MELNLGHKISTFLVIQTCALKNHIVSPYKQPQIKTQEIDLFGYPVHKLRNWCFWVHSSQIWFWDSRNELY